MHAARRRKQLQRDALPELEVVSAVDLAGRPASQETDDAIAAGENAAGRKPRVFQGLEISDARRTRAVEARDGRFVCGDDVAVLGVRSGILRRRVVRVHSTRATDR
jgi:hypothetical protein